VTKVADDVWRGGGCFLDVLMLLPLGFLTGGGARTPAGVRVADAFADGGDAGGEWNVIV
jgi:hypothetical protein